jgi:phosphate transport system permease protein
LGARKGLKRRPRPGEWLVQAFLFACGTLSIGTTVGIVYELGKESLNFFGRVQWENTNKTLAAPLDASGRAFLAGLGGRPLRPGEVVRIHDEEMRVVAVDGNRVTVERGVRGTPAVAHAPGIQIFAADTVGVIEFLTGTEWQPQLGRFGVLPLVSATLMTTSIAMLVSVPLGLAAAVYLSEYAGLRTRTVLKPMLEILAGIPTVVYGYFALTFMTPGLRRIFGDDVVQIYNTASAGIVMGILILPLISSMTEDALSAVPASLRHAAYALGATRLETALKVVLPAAVSGIAAAFLIGVSRAIGETMIVAIAAGAGPALTFDPFRSAETMTGHIVRISGGDLSYDSIDYNSIFAIALLLFFVTLALNLISQRVVRRFREVYE